MTCDCQFIDDCPNGCRKWIIVDANQYCNLQKENEKLRRDIADIVTERDWYCAELTKAQQSRIVRVPVETNAYVLELEATIRTLAKLVK